MTTEKDLAISFQEVWRVATGMSSIQDAKLVETYLKDVTQHLKLGLNYYKPYSAKSFDELKKEKKMSENLQKFVNRSSQLLNVNCGQMHGIIRHFTRCHFQGSKQKLKQILGEEKSSFQLLSDVAEFYFTERLYCLRCFMPMVAYFQDESHPFKEVYGETLSNLPDLMTTMTSQFESLFSTKDLTPTKRGRDCSAEVLSQLAVQNIKEQCEMLQLLILYYSHFEMPTKTVAKMAKLFKDYNFGMDHPLYDITDERIVMPWINSMCALMQVLLIEGFDLELLQETEASAEHQLSKDKDSYKIIDDIITSFLSESKLSPILLSWASVRFVLSDDDGDVMTQKLGEKAVSMNVWREMDQILNIHPFNTKSNVTSTAKRVLRGVLCFVTKSFHEDTLGSYSEIIEIATSLLGNDTEGSGRGLAGYDLDALLLSTSGYFPVNISPLLDIVTSMVNGEAAAVQIHAFISDLPTFSQLKLSHSDEDVESLQDGTCWRLINNKSISLADHKHSIKLKVGTIGYLVNTQQGELIQWQQSIDGWTIFDAEIKSLLEFKGPSSNFRLFGFIEKSLLIFRLVERILASMQPHSATEDTGVMAVMETMFHFTALIPNLIHKIMQMTEPATDVIAVFLRCYVALIKHNDVTNARRVVSELTQIQFLPSSDLRSGFSESLNFFPGIFGQLLTGWERVHGYYPVTMATVDLLSELLRHSMTDDDKMTSYLRHSVSYVTKEVFCCLLKWQRNEDLWDKIGVRCLKLYHTILRHSLDDVNESGRELQRSVVTSLCEQNGAEVLLKIASVRTEVVQAVFVNQPFSASTNDVTEIVQLSLSVLNSLLCACANVSSGNETFIQQALASTNVGEGTIISSIASYAYHRHTSSLPMLSLAILRQIALVAPMSLHANLGSDVAAFRDILLSRLHSRTEHHPIKIAILDFMVVSVQTQPGLLELFLDLELKDKEKPELGFKLGRSSFLDVIIEMLDPTKQGTYNLPSSLHTACLKFVNALWVDKRHSVMQALKDIGKPFWNALLLPLFSGNSPREIAQNKMLETCAHALNVVALESFYMSHSQPDPVLEQLLVEFKEKKRHSHWSKVLVCVCKSLKLVQPAERERHLMFTSAWQTYVITSKSHDSDTMKSTLDDVLTSITHLVENSNPDCQEEKVLLQLCSDLLLTVIHRIIKDKKIKIVDPEEYLKRVIASLQKLRESEKFSKPSFFLHTVAYHLVSYERDVNQSVTSDLIDVTCHHLTLLLRDEDAKASNVTIQAAIVLIQTIGILFKTCESNITWFQSVSRESTLRLLTTVIVKLTEMCNETTEESATLCSAILSMFSRVCVNRKVALSIMQTGCLSQLFLNLANTYDTKSKKWLNVYHVSMYFVSCMVDSLSYDFIDDTLDFLGIHQDRIVQSLSALAVNQTQPLLHEVDHAMALIASTSNKFIQQWKFKMKGVFDVIHDLTMMTCQATVALLVHPKLLQEKIKLLERNNQKVPISTPIRVPLSSQLSTKSVGRDDEPSQEVVDVQIKLVSILGSGLTFLKNLSPNICQVMLDLSFEADGYPRLLTTNLTTPTLELNSPISFGGLISAANFALSALHKVDDSDSSQSGYRQSLTYVADVALVLVMSQCMLLLKQSDVSRRTKQLLRRDLGDDLSSCVSVSRHLRHSSSSYSPQSSPIGSQPVQTGLGKSDQERNILHLASEFVKQVLR